MNLILFSSEELSRPLPVNDPRALHVLTVLKIKPAQSFDVGLVDGPRGKAILEEQVGETLILSFSWLEDDAPLLPVDLLVSFCRPQTCRRILQECTSMGVRSITFFDTEKCEPAYRNSKLWTTGEANRLLIRGAEQAFSTKIPQLVFMKGLEEALAQCSGIGSRIALDNYESTASMGSYTKCEKPIRLAVGGERGWSNAERHTLREAGFHLLDLGNRVLRTETACISALAILATQL